MNFVTAPASPPKASLLERLLARLSPQTPPSLTDKNEPGSAHTADVGLAGFAPAAEPPVSIWVEQNARSPLEAFKDAITDGTRLFCEQNIHPLHALDSRNKFRLTGIQMYVPREKLAFLQILERLPIEVRNRMAGILVRAAPMAADQLVVDDGFFGISVDIEPSVIAGEPVRLIASWSRDSAEIKMVFSGQYISVDPPAPPPQPQASEVPTTTAASVGNSKGNPLQSPAPVLPVVPLQAESLLPRSHASSPASSQPVLAKRETPLGLPKAAPQGKDTPFKVLELVHLATVRVRYPEQNEETVVGITADMLPFMIGREHTSTGRHIHGISLEDPNDANRALLVSREHLEINRFDTASGIFYFVNHAHRRNGTYLNGSALSERFMLPGQGAAVFQLGGQGGTGTVQVTVEAVGHGR